jgi:UDP-N-acetylmuramate: L-alanyl-gamma-D-glutamyl-meso-diaminopimelate ligase
VREQFSGRRLVACLELHTFSSLNRLFLDQYANSLEFADRAAVFYNPQTIAHKRLEMISREEVMQAFAKEGLQVFTSKDDLLSFIYAETGDNTVLLLMSSGTFSGIDFAELSDNILRKNP